MTYSDGKCGNNVVSLKTLILHYSVRSEEEEDPPKSSYSNLSGETTTAWTRRFVDAGVKQCQIQGKLAR